MPALQAAGGEARWLKINSPNFELFTDAGERSGREVARHFEQVRGFFLEAMGLGSKSGLPVRLVVFRSDKEFAPFSPNAVAAAFYLGTEDRDYIIMKGDFTEHASVAVHEYTHLLVRHTRLEVPIWFNEGLAEFYSNMKAVGGSVEVGDPIMPHLELLRRSKWIELQTLLAAKHDSPLYNEKSHAGLFYAECWALVHMLYLDKEYRPRAPVLLEGIRARANMPDTFRKAYGKSVEEVQADLEAHIGSNRFNASLFHLKLPQAADAPDVAEASPLEAGLVLAEVMSSTRGKAAEGRAMYERLAADYPKDWRVEAGLARLSFRANQRDEAMAHFGRAAALGSPDARMYLTYGRLLRAADRRPEAVAALRRAVEIDPAHPQDYQAEILELGFAYLTDEQFAEALTQFQSVKNVPPERAFGYCHAVAYTYYRLDRKADARANAEACRAHARTVTQIAQIDQLMEALDYVPGGAVIASLSRGTHEALQVAEGTLKQIDCVDGKIRMRIASGTQALSFAILNPAAVTIQDGGAADFTCGPQTPKRIRIHYLAGSEVMPGALGVIRKIEFPD